ncbi:hypothetical protein BJX68DRAFT_261814 [Aspergillus pseudodeflectus]|uniref:FAD-binding domain-containing protein n=1 Tax=Aspergillus pseudodeflectus TaxID=176178 RepID=A0ABR4L496_9EURO
MTKKNIIIIGGGMCGLATAISLSQKFSQTSPDLDLLVTVYELRDAPSAQGGPVNLTPKALRCLDKLGVLAKLREMKAGCPVDAIQLFSMRTGVQIAAIDYNGPDGTGFSGYKGWRVMRCDLLNAMVDVAAGSSGVEIQFGKRLTGIREQASGEESGGGGEVRVDFADGTSAVGDVVLGCDGIHSAVRSLLVEPDRQPYYSGIANAYGFVKREDVLRGGHRPFFNDSALIMSRYGSALTTFCDYDRSLIYVVLLIQMAEAKSREGWRSAAEDQQAIRSEGLRRTRDSAIPDLENMMAQVEEWTLYPVYLLPPNGVWHTNRVLLLGDAAHAMPPKGESIGHALEDAIKIASVLSHYDLDSVDEAFGFYEQLQRKKIEDAFQVSSTGWKSNHDIGAIGARIMEWITPLYLWWTRAAMVRDFLDDPDDITFSARSTS